MVATWAPWPLEAFTACGESISQHTCTRIDCSNNLKRPKIEKFYSGILDTWFSCYLSHWYHFFLSSDHSLIFVCLHVVVVSVSSVQSLSCVRILVGPWTATCQASLSITNSQTLLKLMSTESVTTSNHLILCHPLVLPTSVFPSIWIFSNESALLIRWPKYWSFSFNISSSNEHSGLISFRMDWLDIFVVQEILKSLQHHSSKASILQRSAFFIVQLTHTSIHDYWKNHSLD